MNKNEIYEKAIEKWGNELQIVVAIEEMSELTKALCKFLRGKQTKMDIHAEIADVEIMIEQLRIIFDNEKINSIKKEKIKRLEYLLAFENRRVIE